MGKLTLDRQWAVIFPAILPMASPSLPPVGALSTALPLPRRQETGRDRHPLASWRLEARDEVTGGLVDVSAVPPAAFGQKA